MELCCPKCNSTDLKKVSLVYQEGAFRTEGQNRILAAVIGGSGADVLVGKSSTRTSRQSALSKRLSPPMRWSYRRLVFWSALIVTSGGWLVFYINTIATKTTSLSSSPLSGYVLTAGVILGFVLALALRHNHSVYPKQLLEWDRSFICPRCGMVSPHKV
jgi:hypothetical protein